MLTDAFLFFVFFWGGGGARLGVGSAERAASSYFQGKGPLQNILPGSQRKYN